MDHFPDHPFTPADLAERHISRRALRTALHEGRVRRVLVGVYVRAAVPDSIEVRCAAAARVTHADHVVRDRSAAWIHGINIFGWHELELLPLVETSTVRGGSVSRRPDIDGGSRDLAASDIVRIHGLHVTTPLRTALDLGCCLSGRDGLAALDQFMRQHALSRDDLTRQLVRYRRRRGVVQLRRLLSLADARSESPGESWARYDILTSGLASPSLQYWVCDGGVPRYRLDLAYPRLRIAVEYDGEEFHGVADLERDEVRRAWLREQGWYVLVLDKHSFTREAVDAWTAELGAVIRERSSRRRYA